MSNLANHNPKERIWEIDALRGLLILCVLTTHLYYTIDAFCINGYYHIDSYKWVNITDPLHFWFNWGDDGVIYRSFLTPKLVELWVMAGVDGFFVLSGISCAFSRNNTKRMVKVFAAALFITLFTFGLRVWTGDITRFIRFGVLMCFACCQLIYVLLLEKGSSKTLLIAAAPALIVGYFLRYHGVPPTRLPILYVFGVPQIGDMSTDWWPIFPMLGWFLIGAVLGRKFYKDKQTRLPFRIMARLTRPLQFLGRYSGIIYVGHIVLYTAVFIGIGYIFRLL